VRIARALGVDKPRLVILDEPCRSLDRIAREQLLAKIRTTHASATLICITHDISEAIKFPHVVVVGQGTVLEQGDPQFLLQKPESALSHLRKCEQQVLHTILQDQTWEQLHLVNGRLQRGAITTHSNTMDSPLKVEEGANA
jgi:ABC-type proline/glycine betaine transport system ATPase subunit